MYRRQGLWRVALASVRLVISHGPGFLHIIWCRWAYPGRTILFGGKEYRYFYDIYNRTSMNERCIEIPIVWELVQAAHGRRVLEVGNVLSHYFHVEHDIVDRYERAPHVVNEDIVTFDRGERYDLIVSISTLEHVGWDEEPREPMKVARALEQLGHLLDQEGLYVVTFLMGYNPALDELIRSRAVVFDEHYCWARQGINRPWVQVDLREAVEGALFVGFLRKR